MLTTAELVQLVDLTALNAFPREKGWLDSIKQRIVDGKTVGSLQSESSRHIREILGRYPELIDSTFSIGINESSTDIYGISCGLCNAFIRQKVGRNQIIIPDGILKLIRLYADYTTIMPLMQSSRRTKTISIDGQILSELEAFSDAIMASIVHYVDTGESIANLEGLLGPTAKLNADVGYTGAVIFLVAHEMGHLKLGHLDGDSFRSARMPPPLAISELINVSKAEELEADYYAFLAFSNQYRELSISSVLIMFGAFSFAETFGTPSGESHPLTVNRMIHLAAMTKFDGDPEMAEAVRFKIAKEIEMFYRLADIRREHNNARSLVEKHMPIETAESIIERVSMVVMHDGVGYLDVCD